ncbi:PREDICTED: short coiled-coil protein-like isoform X2 [Priapulus caudatus]|uniref:Short coiled-coil protein-like isoform X2 n=1 Tax=Priapulus caudatus TaxID=37621 RepID=A0ABM1EA97_PRICU|nr:PREDICTED: short coiled-coil protein-like isoform X2 [Priapulus caudatus]
MASMLSPSESESSQYSSDRVPLADEDGDSVEDLCSETMSKSDCSNLTTGSISLEPDITPEDAEEKARLISQVMELQNTLDDLSQRVDSVKEENLKLKSENQVLGQYIENLMSASSVFQSTAPQTKKNSSDTGLLQRRNKTDVWSCFTFI